MGINKKFLHLPMTGTILRILAVIIGASVAAVGLELFLMPHGLIVGGITGLSALFAHTTEMRLGLFLFLFNLPFIFRSRRQINRQFARYTVLGLICLCIGSLALHHVPAVTGEPLSAAIGGGICLGLGIGIAVRFGGVKAFPEEKGVALLNGTPPKSSEVSVMLLNCVILFAAGALFGWDQAMYSIIAYLLAFEGVRLSLKDLSRSRSAWITSSRCKDIREVLRISLNRDTAFMEGEPHQGQCGTLFCLTNTLEVEQLKAIVRDCDPHCHIVIKSGENGRKRRIV